ncbi:MAG TPA: DNA recombination protein RmuC [Candidatus Dormibacteraeota bacterium]|nr:DNA recombination protein RmuC [Candidatus Dormibacteraeota bacterium]
MDTTLVLVILIAVMAIGFAGIALFVNSKLGGLKNDTALGLIKQDFQGMHERLDKAATVFGGLQQELGRMQELGRSMRDIQDALKSPKLRGNIGEQMMAEMLSQQIPKGNFKLQHAFRSGEKVDAVIKTRNGLIPIDSKFPAENFLKYVQSKDEAEKKRLHKDFVADVKKHIQAISTKYIQPAEGTVDFAFMYVPGENVFYHIISQTDLYEFGATQRVILVSPQSFYHYLGTVLLSLEGELIEQKAKEVMSYLKGIQGDARKFDTELTLVSKHLTNAKNAADSAVNSYAKLSGKIDSANQLSLGDVRPRKLSAETEKPKEETLV